MLDLFDCLQVRMNWIKLSNIESKEIPLKLSKFIISSQHYVYRRLDDDRGRQTELRQSAVKAMRGIMFCWMQQLDNVCMRLKSLAKVSKLSN